jgi:hypothetical protein
MTDCWTAQSTPLADVPTRVPLSMAREHARIVIGLVAAQASVAMGRIPSCFVLL